MIKKFAEISLAAAIIAGAALPAFAKTATTTPARAGVDSVCMQNAIEKRDTAIIAVVDTYATAVKNALQTRKDALKAAWGETDAKTRRTKIRAAWKAYQDTLLAARRALASGRKGVWNQFYADRRTCGRGAAAEDTGTEGMDARL